MSTPASNEMIREVFDRNAAYARPDPRLKRKITVGKADLWLDELDAILERLRLAESAEARLAAVVETRAEIIEAMAKAIYEFWVNYPACATSVSWEERAEKMPPSAVMFRKYATVALDAIRNLKDKP